MKNFNTSISRRSLVASAFAGLGVVALGGLTACGGSGTAAEGSAAAGSTTLTVAASPAPHAEILNDFAAPLLAKEGIELKVKEYTDYIQPNKDTTSGAVDANYFQHITYLENYNAENGTDLVSAGLIHYEPFAVYAGTSNDLDAIADGATIAVPNDPTNEGRALLLLQDLGLIALSDPENLEATPKDIKDNPHNLKFQELEAAALPRALSSWILRSSTAITPSRRATTWPTLWLTSPPIPLPSRSTPISSALRRTTRIPRPSRRSSRS